MWAFWSVWAVLTLTALALGLGGTSIGVPPSPDWLIPAYGLSVMMVAGVAQFATAERLRVLLYERHREAWETTTTLGQFGPGAYNLPAMLAFALSKDDLGDPEVRSAKNRARSALLLLVATVAVMPFVVVMLTLA
jgi:hypothetical protein